MPFETDVHYLRSSAEWLNAIGEIEDHEAIFHDFSGVRILALRNTNPVSEAAFSTFFLPYKSTDESKSTYEKTFEKLIEAIERGRFEKVILSRTKTIKTDQAALHIFNQLNENYPNTFNYIISNAEIGTWMGATPERLLAVENTSLETMSLAGTKTAEAQWTDKEYREQKLVTETIVNTLEKAGCHNIKQVGPSILEAGKIQHLHTKISCELSETSEWKKLAFLLHPTPAVCGLPTVKAKEFIPELESHDRLFYTGFLGLIQSNKIQLFVNLRCMEFFENKARLYIGGGILSNSSCEAEWQETERKAETLSGFLISND